MTPDTKKVLNERYKIIKSLSSGSFGQTFLAQDTQRPKNPLCVVKQLKPKSSQNDCLEKAKQLFVREAESLELLGEHPQIPRLLAHFEIDNEFYLVEEYIAGETLAQELDNNILLEEQVIDLVTELLNIIDCVHQNKIIHRDIKPSNIIRQKKDGKLFLIDFGAVKEVTGELLPGTIIGTPGYFPSEQARGMPDFCSDIYAIGKIALKALTGIDPHPGHFENFNKDLQGNITRQDRAAVSSGFADILTKMICEHKQERYKSATEVLSDIGKLHSSNEGNTKIIHSQSNKIELNKRILVSGLAASFLFVPLIVIKLGQSNSSLTNLPTNGKVTANYLDRDSICQDILLEQDIYCHKYLFHGQKEQELNIEMNSSEFDPFLILRQPNGQKLEHNGDRSANNWNAQIKAKLPSDGKYTVITRTTFPGESGKYTIRATLK